MATPSTSTVATGRCLFESSYSFIDNRRTERTHSFPEILTRTGLTERIELRLGWNYEVGGGGGSVSGGGSGGPLEEPGSDTESQMLYGFKVALTEQDTWIPQSACIIQGTTPTSGPETASDFQLGYVFGWKFFDDWQLDSSLRYVATKEEGDHFNDWAPSVVLKVPVAERWNVHGEYFGIFTDRRAESRVPQYFSPRIHYLISPDFEVGVRVGWGLNDDAANSFTNVGFGLRFQCSVTLQVNNAAVAQVPAAMSLHFTSSATSDTGSDHDSLLSLDNCDKALLEFNEMVGTTTIKFLAKRPV